MGSETPWFRVEYPQLFVLGATLFPLRSAGPRVWLGVDDTDSLRGMCTTSLVPRLVRLAERRGLDPLGYPKLVRLNPNVPWKTRGNGAVALEFGDGAGEPAMGGEVDGRPVRIFPTGEPAPVDETLFEDACALVGESAHLDDANTNPGVVALAGAAPFRFYRRAVRDVIPLDDGAHAVESAGAVARGWKNGRGRIGALAACGWDADQAGDRTFEVLAYRDGTGSRRIDPERVRGLDARFPSTFDNFDALHGVVRIAPRGPDPVLFGIRGDDAGELVRAQATVGPERPSSWLVFETNQGTDEHVVRVPFREAVPFRSVAVEGIVAALPRDRVGGHVFVDLAEPSTGERITVAAYEPTKGLRAALRALRLGDSIEAYGGVRSEPREINLEKIRVVRLAAHRLKVANPLCACGKAMKSRGAAEGFRCIRCGREAPREAASFALEPRTIRPGWYEACVCARRHLAKPMRRILGYPPLSLEAPTETL